MKSPYPVGSPIDMARFRKWSSEFAAYRHSISEDRIQRWLNQFLTKHHDLAARILDCVDFINHEQINAAFKSLLTSIDGWSPHQAKRKGHWRFVAFSSSAGESADAMLHKFRIANNLSSRRYRDLFIYKSDLMNAKLGPEDTVVFVDDFSGTGKQVCDTWSDIQELLPEGPRIFLLLVAASLKAIKRITNETDINCSSHIVLNERENIFSEKSKHFSKEERSYLMQYCIKADKKMPRGFGECGLVLVFAHRCPNNTIPILHVCNSNWEGLFRRYE